MSSGFIRQRDGLFTLLGHTWSDTTGFALEEGQIGHLLDCLHPDERSGVVASVRKLLDGVERHVHPVVRFLGNDGVYHRVRLDLVTSRNALGSVSGIAGIVSHVCNPVKDPSADGVATDSCLSYAEAILENAPVVLAMFDPDMRLLCSSRPLLNWFDDSNAVDETLSLFDAVPDLPAELRDACTRCLLGEPSSALAVRWRRSDGREDWLRWELRPWWQDDRAVGGVVMFAEIVTDLVLEQQERERVGTIPETVNDFLGAADAEGRLIYLNTAARRLLGLSSDAPLPTKPLANLAPDWAVDSLQGAFAQAIDAGSWSGPGALTGAGGVDIPVEMTIVAHACPDGSLAHYTISARDITHDRESELASRRQGELLRAFVEDAGYLVLLLDLDGKIQLFSKACENVTGYQSSDLVGKVMWEALSPLEEKDTYMRVFSELAAGHSPARHEAHWVAKDGTWRDIQWTHSALTNREGVPFQFVCMGIDITERIEYERRLEDQVRLINEAHTELAVRQAQLHTAHTQLKALAQLDGLTGLLNYRAFREGLDREIRRSVRMKSAVSLLLLDVDFFKSYNDDFGHPAGDEVLRGLAQLMVATARDSDIVARYGGEEFVIVLPDADRAGCLAIAERLRSAIERAPWPDRPITASFGGATSVAGSLSSYSLIAEADRALYYSKKRGRNNVTHAADLAEPAKHSWDEG
jgi:diguanylate cyclase (GGDEF)-like protein/PAS domain S-box-containing protein